MDLSFLNSKMKKVVNCLSALKSCGCSDAENQMICISGFFGTNSPRDADDSSTGRRSSGQPGSFGASLEPGSMAPYQGSSASGGRGAHPLACAYRAYLHQQGALWLAVSPDRTEG